MPPVYTSPLDSTLVSVRPYPTEDPPGGIHPPRPVHCSVPPVEPSSVVETCLESTPFIEPCKFFTFLLVVSVPYPTCRPVSFTPTLQVRSVPGRPVRHFTTGFPLSRRDFRNSFPHCTRSNVKCLQRSSFCLPSSRPPRVLWSLPERQQVRSLVPEPVLQT